MILRPIFGPVGLAGVPSHGAVENGTLLPQDEGCSRHIACLNSQLSCGTRLAQ